MEQFLGQFNMMYKGRIFGANDSSMCVICWQHWLWLVCLKTY